MQSASLESVIESCQRNTVCLKGIISSPVNFQQGVLETLNMKFRCDSYVVIESLIRSA